jgi:hypothetical protein
MSLFCTQKFILDNEFYKNDDYVSILHMVLQQKTAKHAADLNRLSGVTMTLICLMLICYRHKHIVRANQQHRHYTA